MSSSTGFPAPPLTVGQTVHYLSRGSADGVFPPKCRAAIVTDHKGPFCASLAVLNPTGLFFDQDLTHMGRGETPAPGSWHWHAECPETSPTCARCGRVLGAGDALCCLAPRAITDNPQA